MNLNPLSALGDPLKVASLLTPGQREELGEVRQHFPDPQALAGELVRRGWLTPYQVNRLAQGRGDELLLGPYVLLKRLGRGGMGQVFKARHQLMNRLVAIKVIEPERLANPQVVSRFRREIQAAASLSHPHVILAHDAAQAGDTFYLVMEYVEGADLEWLVRRRGPLPVAEACSYVCQAALGLQHAHERGLVHRDVKPSNLLVGADGIVKVLDLGLARLRQRLDEESPAARLTQESPAARLTQEGAVLGTPDFLAPEQARDAAAADGRADVYGLGCTLYFLLTGRPPFPGGSLAEKLLKHQQAEPEPVERLRPDVPPEVAAAVSRMMAKKPGDRYQTPGEVAAALGAVAPLPALPVSPPQGETTEWVPEPAAQGGTGEDRAGAATPTPPLRAAARGTPRNRTVLLAVALCGGLSVCAGLAVTCWFLFQGGGTPPGGNPRQVAQQPPQDKETPPGPPKAPAVEAPPVPPANLPLGPGRLLAELKDGHTGPVQCLAFDPGGKMLASGGDDGQVLLWALPAGKGVEPSLRAGDKVKALAWSPDGKHLAAGSYGGGYDGGVTVWDLPGRDKRALKWKDRTGTPALADVRAVAFAPDGKHLAAGGGPVRVWDLDADREPAVFAWQNVFPSYVYAVVFSPDGKAVLAGCHEGPDNIRRWDVASGTAEPVVSGADARTLGHDDYRAALAFSPDGNLLLRADGDGDPFKPKGNLMTWEVKERGKRLSWRDTFELPAGRVFAVHVRPGGRILAAVAAGKSAFPFPGPGQTGRPPVDPATVQVWDGATNKARPLATGHRKAVLALAFSPDGKLLATGSDDTTIRLWDLSAPGQGNEQVK